MTKAPGFKEFRDIFEGLYLDSPEVYLSEINFKFIQAVNQILGIITPVSWSGISASVVDSSERLLLMCKQAGAKEYLSGPSARDYLDVDLFRKEGISVTWMDYSGYPEYRQQFLPFDHYVSVIDLIFNEGNDAFKYMKSFVPGTGDDEKTVRRGVWLNSQGLYHAMVHSGRAALRLLIISGLNKKKILLPDYLCAVIIDVMRQYKVPYDFYHINPDLTPDWAGVRGKQFDVLYVINYFGHKTKVPLDLIKKKTLLIDDIFSPAPEIPRAFGHGRCLIVFVKSPPCLKGP